MDAKVEQFYRQIFADLKVSPEEASELEEFFSSCNPPLTKLVWLRATAFRLGCDFLSNDHDHNVALLRAINAIVHCLEQSCMVPRLPRGNAEYDDDKFEVFLKGMFSDSTIDQEENKELLIFFQESIPPSDCLVTMRAAIFKTASESLSDDRESNVALFRNTNVVVHGFEMTMLKPKEYNLKQNFDLGIGLSDAIQELWNLDANRLNPAADYVINVQEGKKPYWKENAEEPLFTSVGKEPFQRPTYRAFVALLDNYTGHTGNEETVTSVERREIDLFLDAIMQTAPMQYCHKYLCRHGKDIPSGASEFKNLLYKIWFEFYRREQVTDSSGFEHVFVGEIKNGEVSGMHNWIRFYLEEKAGNIDYKGYIKPRSSREAQTNSDDQVLTLQFDWHGHPKLVGTSFIGTSPEFEMAVYSMCFLLGAEENHIKLDTGTDIFELNIRCYKMARDKIGTAFPEATAHYND
ncbi:endoribonuclease XendoU [Nitzschia inconspicua]|uniref:Endoribonuclease XendoU n=1 Tax=Nitzschia inconspicua TaxID=303405 RepID=A0A9K3K847_9STRA|nr:endoribonuclease XendoU [Nitzschia inconspicua]